MRLLFGREFPFDDVLMMWDVLFAHGLRSDLVDFTCIAMLLRIRWQCEWLCQTFYSSVVLMSVFLVLKADYSSALTMLLRYPSPQPHAPDTFVHDALYLEQNPTTERGSALITKYSGRQPQSAKRHSQSGLRPARRAYLWEDFRNRSESNSPVTSSARNSPKSIETLFQDVSQGIQRRTETWGVARAVRGAVTEAKRNMQTMHYEPNPRVVLPLPKSSTMISNVAPKPPIATETGLEKKLSRLEGRNKMLSAALGEALSDLRLELAASKEFGPDSNDAVKQVLSRVESVQAFLADPSLPVAPGPTIPEVDTKQTPSAPPLQGPGAETRAADVAQTDQHDKQHLNADAPGPSTESGTASPLSIATSRKTSTGGQVDGRRVVPRSIVRPSLSDAGFSWMLDDKRNVSSFVSSASVPPEQTRHQDQSRSKGNPLFGNSGDEQLTSDSDHDELALRSLRSAQGPSSGQG